MAPAQAQAQSPTATLGSLNQQVEQLEKQLIGQALSQTGDNKAKAAQLLDISERSLWYKLKKYFPG
jgi:two-component system response regulator AtoC